MKLAILAKGPSLQEYEKSDIEFDSVWGLNQLGKSHKLSLLFVMDDLKDRMPKWDPDLPEWLKGYQGPILTSKAYPEWPTSESYPLAEVSKHFGLPLGVSFYSSVDYMIALGIFEGYDEIHLFGVDCSTPKREERERVSIGVWIGAAMARGVRVVTYGRSFFNWYCKTGICYEHGLYGYVGAPRIETLGN